MAEYSTGDTIAIATCVQLIVDLGVVLPGCSARTAGTQGDCPERVTRLFPHGKGQQRLFNFGLATGVRGNIARTAL